MSRLLWLMMAAVLSAQTEWPTFNGDYSGRRHSTLKEINAANIKTLGLAWVYRTNPGTVNVGNTQIKSTPLMVGGVLYFTIPDHVWAVDALTGREIWHYKWETKGGIHIGNRGVGIYGDWLFFETPDNFVVSLNRTTGRERWRVEIADVKLEYFSTPAPVVIGNHVIVGLGGDSLDVPAYLEARDPENGALQWRWNATARPGEPGAETWPDRYSMEHGGGMPWLPGTYDPELKLYYIGTGNPNPVHAAQSRPGDNLWTCSVVALNVDTGKLAWHFQSSPHDTHDWDAVQTPVLIDGEVNGQKRKLLAQATRNGHYFLLDRVTGEHLVTKAFVNTNWTLGADAKGQPKPNPAKDPKTDGALVSPAAGGGPNWHAPAFNPDTALLYVNTMESYSVFYLTDTDKHPAGWGGREDQIWSQPWLKAIDYRTGEVRWKHEYPGRFNISTGLLSTAGGLLFTGDTSNNAVAFAPDSDRILWHAGLGAPVTNGPMTYELGGHQFIVFGAADTLYAFTIAR